MTKTIAQEPEGTRRGAPPGDESDAPRPASPGRPHPDDWPDDIAEPDFLELTKVYTGEGESREPENTTTGQGEADVAHPGAGAGDDARGSGIQEPEDFIAGPAPREAHGTPPGPEANPDGLAEAYPAEKARQGRIVLDKPEKRALFMGGLVGMAIVALVLIVLETL